MIETFVADIRLSIVLRPIINPEIGQILFVLDPVTGCIIYLYR